MKIVIREGDEGRGDIADVLAQVIADIQRRLVGTQYVFLCAEVAAEHGVSLKFDTKRAA